MRAEVSPQSEEWGYKLGSVYIRKVHFRDPEMIRQIEGKVVNRLRQVTAAIQQDGTNQVNIITSTAERQAAIEFAKATALRPRIVGERSARWRGSGDRGRAFEVLEVSRLLDSGAESCSCRATRATRSTRSWPRWRRVRPLRGPDRRSVPLVLGITSPPLPPRAREPRE